MGGGEHDLLAGCPDVPVRVEVDEDVVVEVAAEDLLAPVGDPKPGGEGRKKKENKKK